MAGTKPDEPFPVENGRELDIIFGKRFNHRLDPVARLNCRSMAHQCLEVNIVRTQ